MWQRPAANLGLGIWALAAAAVAAGWPPSGADVSERPLQAQALPDPSRGQLLYDAHCVACHDTQVHWRDGRTATDWRSLKAQVRSWQARARLDWSEADIVQVARYLNERIYRFVQTDDLVATAPQHKPWR
jgi:mono/diheme cytochrome c family protein